MVSLPFWCPMTRHGLPLVVGEAADDRVVVGEAAVAVQLVEAGEQPLDVVERVRPVGCRATSTRCHGVSVGVQLGADLVGAPAQRLDRPHPLRRLRQHAEGFDFLQQDADRLFEFEQVQAA